MFTVSRVMSGTRIAVHDAIFFEPKYLPHIFIVKPVTALCHFQDFHGWQICFGVWVEAQPRLDGGRGFTPLP
jgi:hypothetical protein